MTPTDPRHGTYAGTIEHWKTGVPCCDPCATAGRRMRKKNELAKIAGRPGMVELGETAWTIIVTTPRNQLVINSGMSHERLARYQQAGPTKRVHRTTQNRILAAARPSWTPVGIQRRLRALHALGWSMQALGERSDTHATVLIALIRRRDPKHIKVSFAPRILALYDELSMTPPAPSASATRAKNAATRHGYAPPLAWNEDAIDDPQARPHTIDVSRSHADVDQAIVERFLGRDITPTLRATVAEKQEIVRRWDGTQGELARMTGWNVTRYTKGEVA